MKKTVQNVCLAIAIGTVFTGCSTLQGTFNQAPKTKTLYLDDYSKLTKVDTRNGGKALVWLDPAVQLKNYKTLSYQPITYYAGVSANEHVSQDVLNKALNYTNTQVKNELSKNYTITDTNADLEFKGVITKMDASTKTMKIYEALPIMMLYAGGKYLAGERELTTQIIFEGQFIDKKTNRPVLKYIQSVKGDELENKKSQLTVDNVKKALDLFAQDLAYIAK